MKIIQLNVENFKRLSAVEITPDGNVIQITGRNGQGKSSVLDALWCALDGLRNAPEKPIRKGQENAKITIHLASSDTEMIVTRKFVKSGSTLTVESLDGLVHRTPQAVLDALIGELSFDPLAFVAMRPDDQYEALIKIADTGINFAALDAKDKTDFADRTEANREARRYKEAAEKIIIPDDLPKNPIDAAVLSEKIEAGIKHNAAIENEQATLERVKVSLSEIANQVDGIQRELNEAKEREAVLQTSLAACEANVRDAQPIDLTDIRERMRQASEINAAIENAKTKDVYIKDAAVNKTEADRLATAMEDRKAQRSDALAKAKLPVSGLGIAEGRVVFNDVPFSQASTAEQIRVSLALAMAANPKLRVIRINEGSALDSEGLALIASMANSEDYQIWIERVDESGKIGVVIEDGHIAGQKPTPSDKDARQADLIDPFDIDE